MSNENFNKNFNVTSSPSSFSIFGALNGEYEGSFGKRITQGLLLEILYRGIRFENQDFRK